MTTSADSQSTTITYDARRRRSVTTYPTTTNVVTTNSNDTLNRITKISSVAACKPRNTDLQIRWPQSSDSAFNSDIPYSFHPEGCKGKPKTRKILR